MFKLFWFTMVMTMHGPVILSSAERTEFKDKPACEAWGKTMAPRMQDRIRGLVQVDWTVPVQAEFVCHAEGEPA